MKTNPSTHCPTIAAVSARKHLSAPIITGLIGISLVGWASAANILANPGFELGTGPDADDWQELGGGTGSTTRSGMSPLSGSFHMYMQVDNLNNPPAGVALFAEQTVAAGTIDDSLSYNLSLSAKSDTADFTGVDMFYQILWLDQDGSDGGGVKGESLFQMVPGGITTTYQEFGMSDMDAPDGADSFLFRVQLSAGAVPGIVQGLSVDDVSVEAVPEPSSIGLLAVGGLLALRRRRA